MKPPSFFASWLPRGPKSAPRAPQEAPKRAQEGPKRAPIGSQEGPNRASIGSQEGYQTLHTTRQHDTRHTEKAEQSSVPKFKSQPCRSGQNICCNDWYRHGGRPTYLIQRLVPPRRNTKSARAVPIVATNILATFGSCCAPPWRQQSFQHGCKMEEPSIKPRTAAASKVGSLLLFVASLPHIPLQWKTVPGSNGWPGGPLTRP